MRSCRLGARRGFTLIELLVVIAIIAILIALLVPAVQKIRESANKTACSNNLRQMGLAVQAYVDVNKEYPPGRIDYDGGANWAVLILPYLDQAPLYSMWDLTVRYYNQPDEVRMAQVPTYYCPARRTAADNPISTTSPASDVPQNGVPDSNPHVGSLGDYAGCMGNNSEVYDNSPSSANYNPLGFNGPNANGVFLLANAVGSTTVVKFYSGRVTPATITDGTSNTFAIGEKHVPLGKFGRSDNGDGAIFNGDPGNLQACRIAGWDGVTGPTPLARDTKEAYNYQFGSYHLGICQFVFCDGSVRAISTAIDDTNLGRLAARNDGEVIDAEY